MRVEDIIGQRIKDRREAMELSQDALGKLIGDQLGREWTRQAVSAAEKGKRSFIAAELLAIAYVLGMNVGRLLSPPEEAEAVELADGIALPRVALIGADSAVTFDNMMQAIVRLGEQQKTITEAVAKAGEDVARLRELLWAESFLLRSPVM